MSFSKLTFVIGAISMLLLLPLIVIVLVRLLIPLNQKSVELKAETPADFETLHDFWEGIVPHLVELRNRLIKSLLAIGIGTALGFWLVNSPDLLGKPLPELMVEQLAPNVTLQALAVGEVFISYMRIAMVVGITLAMPVIIYQLVAFFVPALLPAEKRIVFIALPFVTELFLAGLAFGWFFTIPAALSFLLNYGQSALISSHPSLESFIATVTTLLLWNGIIFELPAVIYLLAWLGVVNHSMLARTRRYAIVSITIIAALITPTGDPYNLMLLAIPMYILYEIGILLARLAPRQTKASEAAKAFKSL